MKARSPTPSRGVWKPIGMEGWVACGTCSLHLLEEDAQSSGCPRCGEARYVKTETKPVRKLSNWETDDDEELNSRFFMLFFENTGPDPSPILDFLFLGSMFGAKNKTTLFQLQSTFLQSKSLQSNGETTTTQTTTTTTTTTKEQKDEQPPIARRDASIKSLIHETNITFTKHLIQQEETRKREQNSKEDRSALIATTTTSSSKEEETKIELQASKKINILNIAVEVANFFPDDFNYKKLGLDDVETENLLDVLDEACNFIYEAKLRNEIVVVHCAAGVSRSASVVLAYLMRHERMNLRDAFTFLKQKRAVISPNRGFLRQLIEYEKRVFQTNSVTDPLHLQMYI